MRNLVIHVKDVYFQQVKAGTKTHEYRLQSEYWEKRLVDVQYDKIVYVSGYPKRGDTEKTMTFPYRGYIVETITHEHFGKNPATVFSIPLVA